MTKRVISATFSNGETKTRRTDREYAVCAIAIWEGDKGKLLSQHSFHTRRDLARKQLDSFAQWLHSHGRQVKFDEIADVVVIKS